MEKCAFTKLKEFMSKNMELETKQKTVYTLIWSILLYGSESWTLSKNNIKQIEAAKCGSGAKC